MARSNNQNLGQNRTPDQQQPGQTDRSASQRPTQSDVRSAEPSQRNPESKTSESRRGFDDANAPAADEDERRKPYDTKETKGHDDSRVNVINPGAV